MVSNSSNNKIVRSEKQFSSKVAKVGLLSTTMAASYSNSAGGFISSSALKIRMNVNDEKEARKKNFTALKQAEMQIEYCKEQLMIYKFREQLDQERCDDLRDNVKEFQGQVDEKYLHEQKYKWNNYLCLIERKKQVRGLFYHLFYRKTEQEILTEISQLKWERVDLWMDKNRQGGKITKEKTLTGRNQQYIYWQKYFDKHKDSVKQWFKHKEELSNKQNEIEKNLAGQEDIKDSDYPAKWRKWYNIDKPSHSDQTKFPDGFENDNINQQLSQNDSTVKDKNTNLKIEDMLRHKWQLNMVKSAVSISNIQESVLETIKVQNELKKNKNQQEVMRKQKSLLEALQNQFIEDDQTLWEERGETISFEEEKLYHRIVEKVNIMEEEQFNEQLNQLKMKARKTRQQKQTTMSDLHVTVSVDTPATETVSEDLPTPVSEDDRQVTPQSEDRQVTPQSEESRQSYDTIRSISSEDGDLTSEDSDSRSSSRRGRSHSVSTPFKDDKQTRKIPELNFNKDMPALC